MRCSGALLFLGLSVLACDRPKAPVLEPTDAVVKEVRLDGTELDLGLRATNPNGFALAAKSMTGKITLEGVSTVGTVNIATPMTLPAKATTVLRVPLSVKWNDLQTMTRLAGHTGPVRYTVDGTVRVGGERLELDVPVRFEGTMTEEQIATAILRSVPKLPGLPGLQIK
jgi:LEA14-like dessication related protein